MGFLNWFNEEQEAEVPNAKKFLYVACVLDSGSQARLFTVAEELHQQATGTPIPADWRKIAHHMTVKFKPDQADLQNPMMGQPIQLLVEYAATDEFAMAVKVKPVEQLQVQNKYPHITIAHSSAVSAVYSNDLLAKTPPQERVAVTGRVILDSYLLAVRYDQTKIWPETGFHLARS